jgi:hypothetical protein
MTTLAGLYSCLILSLLTIAYYLIEPTKKLAFEPLPEITILYGLHLFSADPIWFLLSVAALALSAYLIVTYIIRLRGYIKRVVTDSKQVASRG